MAGMSLHERCVHLEDGVMGLEVNESCVQDMNTTQPDLLSAVQLKSVNLIRTSVRSRSRPFDANCCQKRVESVDVLLF